MITRRRYTQEEEQIIAEEVSLHQTNIKRGLLIASERLGRSFPSVRYHWYVIQSKRETAFCCFSGDTITKNRKIIRPDSWDNRERTSPSIFSRILRWLGLIRD